MFTFEDHMAQGQQAINEIITVRIIAFVSILIHTALFTTEHISLN